MAAPHLGNPGCCCTGGILPYEPPCNPPCGIGLMDSIPGVAFFAVATAYIDCTFPQSRPFTLSPAPVSIIDRNTGLRVTIPYWNSGILATPPCCNVCFTPDKYFDPVDRANNPDGGTHCWFDVTLLGCWGPETRFNLGSDSYPVTTMVSRPLPTPYSGAGALLASAVCFITVYTNATGDNPVKLSGGILPGGDDPKVWCELTDMLILMGTPVTLDFPG